MEDSDLDLLFSVCEEERQKLPLAGGCGFEEGIHALIIAVVGTIINRAMQKKLEGKYE